MLSNSEASPRIWTCVTRPSHAHVRRVWARDYHTVCWAVSNDFNSNLTPLGVAMLLMPHPLHPSNVHGIKPMCMEKCWLQNQNEFESELERFHLQLKIGRQWASFSEVILGFSFSWIFNTERQTSTLTVSQGTACAWHGMGKAVLWSRLSDFCGDITFIWRHSVLVPCCCFCTQCRILFPVFLFSCTCSFKVHISENNETSKMWLCDACFYWVQVCVLNLLSC